MAGYNNPYVLLTFPDLGDDVSVLMRNPQLLSQSVLMPKDVAVDEHGRPLDPAEANASMYEVIARVLVAWKVYDASPTVPVEVTDDADPVALFESLGTGGAQPRIGAVTVDNVAKLPMVIIKRIMEELNRVADPQ